MAVDGTITSEYTSEEAVAGSNVVLTIDSNLQRITEQALEANIQKIAGGGFGQSITDISKLAPNSKIGEGLSIHYSGGSSLDEDISNWLSVNGIAEQ